MLTDEELVASLRQARSVLRECLWHTEDHVLQEEYMSQAESLLSMAADRIEAKCDALANLRAFTVPEPTVRPDVELTDDDLRALLSEDE